MKDNWIVPKHKYDNIIQQVLFNRGIEEKDWQSFLHPDFKGGLEDSKLLPDFDLFKKRIVLAVERKEKVGIFADYDADGIPGAAFLYRALTKIGLEIEVYIPSRDEGYGLSKVGIDSLNNCGCSLIITVDLGIRNTEEADYCLAQKIDLIITDHHIPGDILPKAQAVVNPKIDGSIYPFKDLSGAGVVFKLIYGLSNYFDCLDEKFIKWNLDLIAISTISDVVSLVGENRVIAKYGIMVLRKTKNVGLQALYRRAKIDSALIGTYQVGFMIGPRLNAPGRLSEAKKSFELLITEDKMIAEELANGLENENESRQQLMADLFEDAEKIIAGMDMESAKVIVIKGKWQKGIIGPSASRIAEKYSRPVIILTEDGDKLIGSARSVNDINITELIEYCSDLLEKYGGHKGAAGLSLKKSKYSEFLIKLKKIASDKINNSQLTKRYKADAEIGFGAISSNLCNSLKDLEPYGMGNPRPTFVTSLAKLVSPRFVGSSVNHLSSSIEQQNKKLKSIYFNCPYDEKKVNNSENVDLIYSIDEEQWNGKKYLKINIIDMEIRAADEK